MINSPKFHPNPFTIFVKTTAQPPAGIETLNQLCGAEVDCNRVTAQGRHRLGYCWRRPA